MLGFDVPTFVFQIINFLILLALLTRFVYKPVLGIMDRRQAEIDQRLADADERARQADEERQQLSAQAEAARKEASKLTAEARANAARERQQVLDRTRLEASELIDSGKKALAEEERLLLARLSTRLTDAVVSVAGTIVRQAAGPEVHQRLVDDLVNGGLGLEGDQKRAVQLAIGGNGHGVTVEQAYPLDDERQGEVRQSLAASLGTAPDILHIEFVERPQLLAGVRVLIGMTVIDLSLQRLLEELSRQAVDGQAMG